MNLQNRPEKIAGGLATLLGIGVVSYLLLGPRGQYERITSDGTTETGIIWGIDLLFGGGQADLALIFWSLLVLGLVFAGSYGVWAENRRIVLAVAILLLAFSIVAIASIGLIVVPVALLFMLSGILFYHAQRRK